MPPLSHSIQHTHSRARAHAHTHTRTPHCITLKLQYWCVSNTNSIQLVTEGTLANNKLSSIGAIKTVNTVYPHNTSLTTSNILTRSKPATIPIYMCTYFIITQRSIVTPTLCEDQIDDNKAQDQHERILSLQKSFLQHSPGLQSG